MHDTPPGVHWLPSRRLFVASHLRLALAAWLLAGCTLPELDLTAWSCPCAEGWVCDVRTDRCSQLAAEDDSELDGGELRTDERDAGSDDSPVDAATECDKATARCVDAAAPPVGGGEPLDAGVVRDGSGAVDDATMPPADAAGGFDAGADGEDAGLGGGDAGPDVVDASSGGESDAGPDGDGCGLSNGGAEPRLIAHWKLDGDATDELGRFDGWSTDQEGETLFPAELPYVGARQGWQRTSRATRARACSTSS